MNGMSVVRIHSSQRGLVVGSNPTGLVKVNSYLAIAQLVEQPHMPR